jgi:hypothetical protein
LERSTARNSQERFRGELHDRVARTFRFSPLSTIRSRATEHHSVISACVRPLRAVVASWPRRAGCDGDLAVRWRRAATESGNRIRHAMSRGGSGVRPRFRLRRLVHRCYALPYESRSGMCTLERYAAASDVRACSDPIEPDRFDVPTAVSPPANTVPHMDRNPGVGLTASATATRSRAGESSSSRRLSDPRCTKVRHLKGFLPIGAARFAVVVQTFNAGKVLANS